MKIELQSTVSLMVLSIVNMCLCLQDYAEKTLSSFSGTEFSVPWKVEQNSQISPASLLSPIGDHHQHRHDRDDNGNFLLIDYLNDGEMERRIRYNGITAKETSIGNNTKSLSLWQLSNGFAFIQMIYSKDDELIDCEYVRKKDFVSDFLNKFYTEIDMARARNFTTTSKISSTLFNYGNDNLMSDSESKYEDLKNPTNFNGQNYLSYEENDVADMQEAFGMRTLTYKQIRGAHDVPMDMLPLLDYPELKKKCDNRHRQLKRIVHDMNSEHAESRKNATEHLERKKRAISDWFIAPNTKWCGRGQSADKYNQLGGATKADKCCRRHDHCRFNIHAMTTKWHLFNFRPFTVSHCSCDMRFRTCLKMADSSDATMVGKLFFNIVQSKCFVLKPEKICKKRSWWGKCEKKVIRKRAHLRDNRKF